MNRREAKVIALEGAAQAVSNLIEEGWPYGDDSLTDEDCERVRTEMDAISKRLRTRAGALT